MKKLLLTAKLFVIFTVLITLESCTPNDPYRAEDSQSNTYYSTFDEAPKTLDPARSYYEAEYGFLAQIYEPLVQYHYLKRPFELVPLTSTEVPKPTYFDSSGNILPDSVAPSKVSRVEYDINIKEGIKYQPHPAFATSKDGELLYHNLKESDLKNIKQIIDFPKTSTRELTVDDYMYQIKRMADPRLHCPILPIISKYILGLDGFALSLKEELASIREKRKKLQGAGYNQTTDEMENPILLDYNKFPIAGLVKTSKYNFKIILKNKYPQFIYWLAMSFFSPMPEEAIKFYGQAVLKDKNINLNRFPVGTGAYRMDNYLPNMEITMVKNENFHGESYPQTGEAGDKEQGLLKDKGKPLPLIDKLVFKLEKESIPRWNKFLQGYYDASGITSDSYDQAVATDDSGSTGLTPFMKEKGIGLIKSISSSTYYLGFNMLDDVVGGYSEKNKKLRQAISIAFNFEEFIEIFSNGRGVPAQGPIPPGIFGYKKGQEGINPFVYNWNERANKAERKSIEEAKELLAEAGYPGGIDIDGNPLVISFDNAWTGAGSTQTINWLSKRLKLIGIQMENKTTDYNRYSDKLNSGAVQLFFLGWNADYPDPENFFFLLYSGNGRVAHKGENTANYSSPNFDKLFKEMENMDNSPERLAIIDKINRQVQEDSPWVWAYHPMSFSLANGWLGNRKANTMANNTIKYISLDQKMRTKLRYEWNRPLIWPLVLITIAFGLLLMPTINRIRKKM